MSEHLKVGPIVDRQLVREIMGYAASNHTRLEIVREALREAIANELTPRQREVVTMYYFERLREVEIARRLQVNPSTVCRTLQRARKSLEHSLRFYVEFLNRNLDD